MSSIINAPIVTRLSLNPERVLEAAFGKLQLLCAGNNENAP